MLPRFLAESIDFDAGIARLSGDEARHLAQVLRLEVDDDVAVFDGAGREFARAVARAGQGTARSCACSTSFPRPLELVVRLTLAQAVDQGREDGRRRPRRDDDGRHGDRAARHRAHGGAPEGGRAPERWRRIAIASAKQCRRAVVPAIGAARRSPTGCARSRARRDLLVEPSAAVEGHPLSTLAAAGPHPRRSWSARRAAGARGDRRRRRAGCVPITLGRRTLRADAVPIVAIGVLQFVWGDL
jgi:16S rRNA (uracil1498-N3)-methyltransferase